MLGKTRGIVLHSIPYNDNYSIVHIYTEQYGRAAYMIAGGRKKKKGLSPSLFMPFSLLDMEVDHTPKRDIHRIKEAHCCIPLVSIASNPIKSVLALFLSEVLLKTVKGSESDKRLFSFLYNAISLLEETDKGIANYHMVFLFHLLYYIGIYPNTEKRQEGDYFDMLNSVFVAKKPEHGHFLSPQETTVFARLIKMSFENMALYTFTRQERVRILEHILAYYRLHLPDFSEIRSLAILQTIFD